MIQHSKPHIRVHAHKHAHTQTDTFSRLHSHRRPIYSFVSLHLHDFGCWDKSFAPLLAYMLIKKSIPIDLVVPLQ